MEVEPVYLEAFGHDQHVLTAHEIDGDGSPPTDRANAVSLDSEGALGYRAAVTYQRDRWGYGLDFLIFRTDQQVDLIQAAADGPARAIDRRELTVAGRGFTSVVLGEVELTRTLRDFSGPADPFSGPPEQVPAGLTSREGRGEGSASTQVASPGLQVARVLGVGRRVDGRHGPG